MLGLVGVIGGAAAIEIRRLRRRDDSEEARERRDMEERLERLVQQRNRELEQERRLHREAQKRLRDEAAALRALNAALAERSAALERAQGETSQQNAQLALENMALAGAKESAEQRLRQLDEDRQQLAHELEQLQMQQRAAGERFAEQLVELKQQVSSILSRLLGSEIGAEQAAAEMAALGCEVRLVEAAGEATRLGDTAAANSMPDASVPQLVLDDPAKMQRLLLLAAHVSRRATSSTDDLAAAHTRPLAALALPAVRGSSQAPRLTFSWLPRQLQQLGLPQAASGQGAGASAQAAAPAGDAVRPASDSTSRARPAGGAAKAALEGQHLVFAPSKPEAQAQPSQRLNPLKLGSRPRKAPLPSRAGTDRRAAISADIGAAYADMADASAGWGADAGSIRAPTGALGVGLGSDDDFAGAAGIRDVVRVV